MKILMIIVVEKKKIVFSNKLNRQRTKKIIIKMKC